MLWMRNHLPTSEICKPKYAYCLEKVGNDTSSVLKTPTQEPLSLSLAHTNTQAQHTNTDADRFFVNACFIV